MTWLGLALVLWLPQAPGQQPAAGSPPVDVAIFPLSVGDALDSSLTAVADSCIARLTGLLGTQGLRVVRRPASARRGLRTSGTARFAIDGTISREAGEFAVALRLLDAATDEELRSYFYRGKEPAELFRSGEMVAARVAKVVREP